MSPDNMLLEFFKKNFGKWGLNFPTPLPHFHPPFPKHHSHNIIISSFSFHQQYFYYYGYIHYSWALQYAMIFLSYNLPFLKSWYLSCFIMRLVYYILIDNSIPQANCLSLPSVEGKERVWQHHLFRDLSFLYSTLTPCSEKAMAPHSNTLAWKIPWTEEPGRLRSMGSLRVGHDWLSDFTFTFHFHALEKEMATHSSVLAWRIPGMGSLVGCRLWGHTESDTTEAT